MVKTKAGFHGTRAVDKIMSGGFLGQDVLLTAYMLVSF